MTFTFTHDGYKLIIYTMNYYNPNYKSIGYYVDCLDYFQPILRDSLYGEIAKTKMEAR